MQRLPKLQWSSPLCPASGPACRLSNYQETLNKLWKVPFAGTSHITKWCTRAPAAGWRIPKFPITTAGWWDLALGGRWRLFGAAGWDGTLLWSSSEGKGVVGTWGGLLQSVPRLQLVTLSRCDPVWSYGLCDRRAMGSVSLTSFTSGLGSWLIAIL